MSEKNKYLKDQFERGKQLGEDKSISAGDAVRQIMGEARAEFQAAASYFTRGYSSVLHVR